MKKTMCIATLVAAMSAGAHAQLASVSLGAGVAVEAVNGLSLLGAAFGSGQDARVCGVPAYLQQDGIRYFQVDRAQGDTVTLVPEGVDASVAVGASASVGGLQVDAAVGAKASVDGLLEVGAAVSVKGKGGGCGRGWAKHPTASTCFEDIDLLAAKNWGWTNKIRPGEDVTLPVYIGAAGCTGGHHRYNIRVRYAAGDIEIDLTPGLGDELRSAHVYVGTTPLPVMANGKLTNAPGQFPINVNVNNHDVLRVSELLPGLVIDDLTEFYFAVHVNVCSTKGKGKKGDAADAADEAEANAADSESSAVAKDGSRMEAPTCATTFLVAVYACMADKSCMERTQVADVHKALSEDGWTSFSDSLHFKMCEKCKFQQNTRMYMKKVSAEEGPVTIPSSPYMGVFTAGCGTDVRPARAARNIGPVRNVCGDFCPVETGVTWFPGHA